MIARVFRYSFAQARTRALRGKLLNAEDWHFLLNMRRLDDLLKYLSGTGYAPVVERFAGPDPLRGACRALYEELFHHAAKLMKSVPGKSARILADLLLRYEAENVKIILRGLWWKNDESEILPLLYPLGALSRVPVHALLRAGQVTTALDLLQSTPFHASLAQSHAQFEVQGRLFPLEIAIDHAAFNHMQADLSALKGLDRRKTRDLTGTMVDGLNLAWVARFRHMYGLSPEETINYLLVGGRHLTLPSLGKLARAPDLPAFLAVLPVPCREALAGVAHWGQVQSFADRWFASELHAVFAGDPFQIGLPISYLLLKEREVKSLECLLSAMALGDTPEKRMEPVVLPIREAVRV
ncbi:MAG: V-type ATPase subunit [Deltaproteobacteria bacterium]|nr:V-type ATPase subunit [Deltaproteobacteria bacterium]